MPDSPLLGAEGLVRVSVLSEGRPVPEAAQLVSATVTRAVNRLPAARLVFIDGDMARQEFALSDADHFKPGAAITVQAGYGDWIETLFEGIVTQHALQIAGGSQAHLVVECSDKAVTMTQGRQNAQHIDKADSDIIHALIAAHGLTADVQQTEGQHRALVQHHCSDWDFMLARAAAHGLLVIAAGGQVRVQAPATAAQPTLKVTDGADLMEFHAGIGDAAAQQPGSGLRPIRGHMRFQGSAKAVVGGLIEVLGVGQRFSGTVFVGGVTHSIDTGGWVTEVDFGLAPEWFTLQHTFTAPGVAGLLPTMQGLQIGMVMQLEGDPGGQHRVKVSVPSMQAGAEGLWARLLQFHGSKGFGAFFVPEVGDEVVLGYFNNDPSHPVILGSLYSSSRAPAHELDAQNSTKSIVTRGGSRIEFNDVDQRITVSTPGLNQLVLSDEGPSVLLHDQHGNQIALTARGITLTSPGDITLSAQGQITIDAVGAVSISSTADVKVAGLNVSSEAQVALTAKGTASAELSATGQTVVKGALVLIN